MDDYQEPPHDNEMEQVFLGSCLMFNQIMDGVIDFLKPEHFSSSLHQVMYEHFVELFINNVSFTPISIKGKFEGHSDLGETTSGQYLSRLSSMAIVPKVAVVYGKVILDYFIRRTIINASYTSQAAAFNKAEKSGPEIIEDISNTLSGLSRVASDGEELYPISKGVDLARAAVVEAMSADKTLSGVTTGLDVLDKATGGLKSGQLVIIAGRPAMGKTALALTVAKGAARSGKNVAVFSIEMESDELTLRLACDMLYGSTTPISYFDAGNGNIDNHEHIKLCQAFDQVARMPIHISDRGGNTVDSVRIESRRLNRILPDKIDLIVIDYLQLMTVTSKYKGNRVQEISEITSSLKRLAKEMNTPILLLSQLNRGLESRDNKRPLLSDLRDSGAIEQDADIVLFVYRDHYYLKNNEPNSVSDKCDWLDDLKKKEHQMELIIAKQRRGPTKTLYLDCFLHSNAIRDVVS
jgi:replicative DNA helicase